MSEKVLQVQDLVKRYGTSAALYKVSFSLLEGEVLAVIGRSGSGKTTLLKCVAGLESLDEGDASLAGMKYLVNGQLVTDGTILRRDIVSVLQGGHLFPSMTCMQNLTFPLVQVRQLPVREARKQAAELAEKLGVIEMLARYPDEVSGGQAQRLALARALLLHPKVLLLDEITSALDPATTIDVVQALRLVKDVSQKEKMGMILVTHHLRFAFAFADKVGFLENGQLLEIHPGPDFVDLCKSDAARSFLDAQTIPL